MFLAADKLRKNLEPSDHKHVALGLIFLKHISNTFEAKHAALLAEDPTAAEDPDEYLAENVFWVPKEARWSHLQANAKQPTIGKLIDEAMAEIEKANPGLKGVLPKDYNRPALDKVMLGELIDLVCAIKSIVFAMLAVEVILVFLIRHRLQIVWAVMLNRTRRKCFAIA